jgi:RNA polymerase sigma factor (sigma-70 family)
VRERHAEVRCFKAWLYQVARHAAQNRIRSRSRGARAVAVAAFDPTLAEPPRLPDRAIESEERRAALARAVAGLPAPLAEVYRLRSGGASYDEIAIALEVPVGTVKSRMNELVHRLRSEVKA